MTTSALKTQVDWEGRAVQLSYSPRRWTVIDHVEIRSPDGEPLPITATGYRSHFFGPVEPAMTIEEVTEMVIRWLDAEAQSLDWLTYLEQSKQLSLF